MTAWRNFLHAAMFAMVAVCLPATARADDGEALLRSRIDEVVAVMAGKRDPAETFDTRFLTAVPPDRLKALAAQLVEKGGPVQDWADFKREQQGSASFTLRFAHASAPARIELNPGEPGLVSGFRIFGLTPDGDSFDKLDAAFAALPGTAGFAVYRLGDAAPTLVHGRSETTAFAVGSTFKLYVLAALARQVQAGQRHWTDIVPVSGKSFPSGTIHTLPDNAPVTLHTLASLMISISDNTATDMLVRLVGQPALAQEVARAGHAHPEALAPMLTTAQLFALKRKGGEAAAGYAAAAPAERERLLAALDLSTVAEADPGEVFGHGPVAIAQAEWFASPADLAGVMNDLRAIGSREVFDILAINPAMDAASAHEWGFVGYKGGSEDGVMSMTWLLRDKAGQWSVATGSWNDLKAVVDDKRFEGLMQRVAKLAQGS